MISVGSVVQVHPGPRLRKDRRGHSSAGRAPALQAGGHRFDSDILHLKGIKVYGNRGLEFRKSSISEIKSFFKIQNWKNSSKV